MPGNLKGRGIMMKQKAAHILVMMLIICIWAFFLPQGALTVHAAGEVCSIGPNLYTDLADALAAAVDGDKILLLENITYNGSIIISGKDITFDLNNYELEVVSTTGTALHVINADVGLESSGEFNVTGLDMGVYAESDTGESASVTVTNASSTGESSKGAYADGDSAVINVKGNVTTTAANSIGAHALDGGQITIDGIIDSATGYVVVGSYAKGISDITLPTTKDGYRTYTDGISTVWVKMQAVCEIDGGAQYESLDDALNAAADGDTIRLLSDINRNTTGIIIDGKDIIFDLNGHALNVVTTANEGLCVINAVVDIAVGSTGTFDVTGSNYGVYVDGAGASATVTGAHSTGTNSRGAYACNGAVLNVRGDVTATGENSIGASALNGSNITVAGDVEGINCGAVCFDAGSWIHIYGNCESTYTHGIGARSGNGGEITIDGVINSSGTYIMIGSTSMGHEGFTPQTDRPDYLKYTDGTSTVWVKVVPVCEIDGGLTYSILDSALTAAVDGNTIRLLGDINRNTIIEISDKSIILDLNGHDLNVNVPYGVALYVSNGGISSLTGSGNFNVTGIECGVEAEYSGVAYVTNARNTGTDGGAGVAAYGESTVTILNEVYGAYRGIDARGGSTVFANGDVTGNVETGVSAYNSTVFVNGDVTGSLIGVEARGDDCRITVRGNVTSGYTGAMAYGAEIPGIFIIIDGELNADGDYIMTGGEIKDGSPGSRTIPSVLSGYHTYSDGTHSVCIRILHYITVNANPGTLPSSGGNSNIIITGSSLPSGITVTAFDGGVDTGITGITSGSGTEQSVILSFPANTSTTEDKVYTIRIMLPTEQDWSLETTTVTVGRATSSDDTGDSQDDDNSAPPNPPPADDVPMTEEVVDQEPDDMPEEEASGETPEEPVPDSDTDVVTSDADSLDDVPKTGDDTESFPAWPLWALCVIIPAGFTVTALARRNRKCS